MNVDKSEIDVLQNIQIERLELQALEIKMMTPGLSVAVLPLMKCLEPN